jgi:YesN/AraC family two-component response regulator
MKKILLIEDDIFFQKMLSDLLKIEGYEVEIANNGKLGVIKYKECEPDLVITDIIMPEKEGTETILELKAINPEVKIIAISGGGRVGYVDYLQTVKEFGVEHTFSKPFNNQDMFQKINDLLA